MDFEQARFNMVEQQIRPWEVLDQSVLDLLFVVKREDFVPAPYRSLAFNDMDLPLLADGRQSGEHMFSPKVEARLLQELQVGRHESVLEIGAGSGYFAALLSHRAREVTAAEIHPELHELAMRNLRRNRINGVRLHAGNGLDILAGGSRFDVIVVSGGIAEVPAMATAALNVHGRLFAFVGEAPAMTATIIQRVSERGFSEQRLFESVVAGMHGFPQPSRFTF